MSSFLLQPVDQARIYNMVSTREYTVGQKTKFLGTTLKGAPIFTTITNDSDNKSAVTAFIKSQDPRTRAMSTRTMQAPWSSTMKPRLTRITKEKVTPMTGEKLPEVGDLFKQGKTGNAYDHYHPLKPQCRNTILTEMKCVQDWGVYINDGIYHRCERTMISKASGIMHKTQLDVINSEAEWPPYHIQHAVYGLNISLLTWIQHLSSRQSYCWSR